MMNKKGKQKDWSFEEPGVPKEFSLWLDGGTNRQLEEFKCKKTSEFQAWLARMIVRVIQGRKMDIRLASTVENLDQQKVQKLKEKALVLYLIERDLFGPLIAHFTLSIYRWQRGGILPGISVALLRDFQPFYIALKELDVDIRPWYLRRDLFGMVKGAPRMAGHDGKLAKFLKPLLTEEHVNLLDSGCWGTVVYEIASLRVLTNWLSNSGAAKRLYKLKPQSRVDALQAELPAELRNLLNTGLNKRQVSIRWGVAKAIVQENDYLEEVIKQGGRTLTTSALFHYSHAYRDSRYSAYNHRMIYSHIDAIASEVMPNTYFGEVINDAMEENLASKDKVGPTRLIMNGKCIEANVERNLSFETEVLALAANEGARHSIAIAKEKQGSGIPLDPKTSVAHIACLYKSGKKKCYNGVFIGKSPTWSRGRYFLSKVWPTLTNNPYSTYVPFDPEKGVQI